MRKHISEVAKANWEISDHLKELLKALTNILEEKLPNFKAITLTDDVLFNDFNIFCSLAGYDGDDETMVKLKKASIDWAEHQNMGYLFNKMSIWMVALKNLKDDVVSTTLKQREAIEELWPDIKDNWKHSEFWRQYGVWTDSMGSKLPADAPTPADARYAMKSAYIAAYGKTMIAIRKAGKL
eukprot:GHVO01025737.1.p1 GENE.GHVO01025737.1~~GHVO01025737.1.p1  ORF type:complete len:182 (-),score=24.32 GHVO01025737.1:177-722(-)